MTTDRNAYEERTPAYNSTYKRLTVQCPADTFVDNQTFVLRIHISGKNRHLRQAAERVCLESMSSTNIECFTKDGRQL